jgi:phage baseplate assembly protein W
MNNFLGIGIDFDFGFNQYGEVKKSAYEASIEDSMNIILSTRIGERIMREDFGCRIHELLFAPNTTTTHNLMIYYVTEALKKWENRILLKDVKVIESSENSVNIDIEYQVRDTNSFYNLVYPFYLTEQP